MVNASLATQEWRYSIASTGHEVAWANLGTVRLHINTSSLKRKTYNLSAWHDAVRPYSLVSLRGKRFESIEEAKECLLERVIPLVSNTLDQLKLLQQRDNDAKVERLRDEISRGI